MGNLLDSRKMLVCFPTKQDSFYQQHDAVDCKSDQTSNQHVCHDGSGFILP